MSQDANSETEAYDKEYDAFLKQLDEFHQQRGTAFKRLPRINGKGVDLYLLYVVVTARGGWQKVNARNEWEEILEDFRLPAACVNSSVALKQIYMRYLDAYERVTFLGNDGDDKNNDNDDDDSSHPAVRGKKSVRALNVVPLTYNAAQHNVAESLREGAKLCTSLFKPSQYDRLCMSLTSPLPNEHDFSFNLCTLLSNEGRQVMHLAQCPRLLEIMLGHVGVFRDDHCQKYFVSNIRNQKGKNLVQFWVDSIGEEQKHVLEVLVPPQARRSSRRGRLELPTSAPGDSGAADMDTSDMSVDSGVGTTGPGEGAGGKGGSCSAGRDASNAVDEGGGGVGVKVNDDCKINSTDDDRGDCKGKSYSVREHIPPHLSSQTTPSLPVNNMCSSSSGKMTNNDSSTAGNASSDSEVIKRYVNTASSVPSSSNEEKENESEQSNEDSCRKRSENSIVYCLLEKNSKETSDLERDNIYERLKKELGMSDCLTSREEVELFHCGRDSGLQDSEGTRIAQLIHILRNLSFEEDNVATLAQSNTCLRFLVLCLCSRFGGLAVQALDTLGNISHEVILGDPCGLDPRTSSLLLSSVADGVFSDDRARVLRSLEVLNRLAMSDANEDVMAASIRQEVFDQICRYLTVHDIMLLIYTLESLYSLSSLGSASCNAIVRAPGSIHTLVALLTVEAQSYGPGACIGMKVVETVTGVVSDPDTATSTNPSSSSTMTTGSTAAALPPITATPSATLPPHSIATPHHPSATLPPPAVVIQQPMLQQTPLLSSVVSTPTLAAANAAALQQQLHHNANNNNTINSNTVKTPLKNVMDMKKSVMSSTVASDVEDFVCDWIKRSYEHYPGTMLEQAVVFRHFSSSMHALGKKQGFNPVLLSSCFRKVYGFKVGPTRHNPKDASDKWYYHDLRRRDTPLPMKVNDKLARGVNKVFNSPLCHTPVLARPSPDPSNANMSGSSILKAQLSAPLRPISPAATAAAPRIMQQQQQQQPSPAGASSQQVSPISSPPPPYSPNPGLSPRPPHSPSPSSPYTPPPHSCTPPPPPLPPPGGRQENSALIKSLLANKVTSVPSGLPSVSTSVVGGLASMLAAPSLLTQPTTNTASPQLTYHQQMASRPSPVTQQHQYHYSPHQTPTTSSLSATTSSSPSMLLPPPPPYPQHKVRQALPSMQVPTILKESPPPLPPSMVSTTITSTPTYYTTQANSSTLPPPSSMSLPPFTRHYQHLPTAEQIPSSAVSQDQVSRNIQKQQQQAADSTSNNNTLMADTNGSINNRMLVNAAVNGVGFYGEPIKSEEDSSNSLASTMTLDVRKVTSFEGILQNGIATSSEQLPPPTSSASHPVMLAAPGITQYQIQQSVNPSAVSTIVQNTFHDPNSISHNQQQSVVVCNNTYSSSSSVVSSSNSSHSTGGAVSPNALNSMAPTTIKKNVLADLLEKTLGGDILNGVVDKELRITDNNRMLPNGPIIINNVSVNNSTSSYGVVGTTTMGGGGGLKRPGSEDYDESGAKRLAIDRGDGKITLYVSQNGGDGDGTLLDSSVLGSAPPPQQVVISGHNAMSLLAGGNITAGGQKQQLVTSHGQIISSGTQLVTSSGQLVTGTQLVTSSGQLVTSGGQLVTSSGQLFTTEGQLVTSGGEQFVTSCGQLISASGQLVTTQGGQKMVVQGNFGQMLGSGQMVLSSQGGHIVVSGNGGGGEAVLMGGQLIQQGTQLIAATTQQGGSQQQQTTHIVGQGTQLVTTSGQIINPGQSHIVGTGGQVVVTQGQIISQGQQPQMISSQGQLIQNQGQVLTQGSTGQIVGGQLVSQGQIMSQGQGQIMSQGQIVTQGQGQIISQQGQGQIISQGNVHGQIISHGGGQVVLQTSGQIGSQGHSQLMTQGQGQFITQGQGQLITQGQGHIISQGQILTQGQVINSRGQLVAQGQIINSDQCQTTSSGQLVQGQIISQSQGQIVTQQGQLISHGQGQLVQQGHVIAQSQQGQVVSQVQGQIISQGQVVTQNQRQVITQGPIVSQGQVISQGGTGQLVTQGAGGGTILTQSGGQILGHQTGSTFLVQQSPGAGKTLIILPAGQKVIQQQQHQQQQSPLVVQQQQSSIPSGGQVLQVVTNSSGSSSIMRTIAAGTIITTTTTSSVPGGSISGGVHFTGAQQQQHMAPNAQGGQQHHLAGPPSTTSLPHHIPTSSIIQQPPHQLQQPPPPQPAAPHVPAPQILASGIVRRHPSNSNMVGVHSNPPKPGGLQYLCEWRGCNCVFASPQQVYHHVCKVHCPPHLAEVQCLWAGCDPMVRKRFSAMTHLHDRHCNEQLLNILAVRRQQIATIGKTELPVPHAPPPHPGYAPNAAFHAIKRHALEVITQRDVVENEGPVTKSIRLTSALILRNLVIYSNSGRKLLRGYESELCNVAISTLESSRTVAQILHDIHLTDQ